MTTLPAWARAWDDTPHLVLDPPSACITVTLQGLTAVSDGPGALGLTGWDGWTEAPDYRGGPVAHETADGGLEGEVIAGGREITLEGFAHHRNHRELEENIASLGTVLSSPRWDWLRVDEEELGLSRMIHVCRLSRPQITRTGPTSAVWTLRLASASAVRLDTTPSYASLTPGTSRVLTNAGSAPADLTAMIYGPVTDLKIAWPGGSWTYKGTVPSGVLRQVDFTRRIVRDPGTSLMSRTQVSGTWPRLAPGDTTFTCTGTGAGRIDFGWRSTWH